LGIPNTKLNSGTSIADLPTESGKPPVIQSKKLCMSELKIIHFLKISGAIAEEKKVEFENTIRYAIGRLNDQCLVRQLSAGILENGGYYFFTEWVTEPALKKFILSEEYHLIRTAYDVLGVLQKIEIGYNVQIQTILINC